MNLHSSLLSVVKLMEFPMISWVNDEFDALFKGFYDFMSMRCFDV